jgi:hypothetical protein
MFASFKPVAFNPYGSRRRSRRWMPRWLVLLLLGGAVGVAGVLLVQARYLPPRLSADASAALTTAYQQADAERTRLRSELDTTLQRLRASQAERQTLAEQLDGARGAADKLRKDVSALVDALPPDPRGGEVAVRSARFELERGALAYDVVLSRDRANRPFNGVVQFVLSGDGKPATVALKPLAVTVGAFESLRGTLPLPEGFRPREAAVHVLDRPDGKRAGMRVVYVK